MSSSRSHKEEKEDLQMQQVPSQAPPLSDPHAIGPAEQTIPLSNVPTRGQGEAILLPGPKKSRMTGANPSGPKKGRGTKR
jgi:hypothetical protein